MSSEGVVADLFSLFQPAIDLVLDWLNIQIKFGVTTFPLWAVFAFLLLLGIFMRLISALGGFDFGVEHHKSNN